MIDSASLIVLKVLWPNGLSIVPIIFSDSSDFFVNVKIGVSKFLSYLPFNLLVAEKTNPRISM